jgi:SAM-dependent methyltransferase
VNNHLYTEGNANYECPFCQNRLSQFIPWPDEFDAPQTKYEMWNKYTAICPFCYSMDRERMYRLFIERATDLLNGPKSVLHISTEVSLQNWLMGSPDLHYVGGYLTSTIGMRKIDIASLGYPDDMFDAVICSHTLDRVPDDLQAMKELYRVMKEEGWGIMQVPISLSLQSTKERPLASPEPQSPLFDRDDHLRVYAKEDYIKRLRSVGFMVHPIVLSQLYGIPELTKYGLSSTDTLYLVTKRSSGQSGIEKAGVRVDAESSNSGVKKSWWFPTWWRNKMRMFKGG